MRSFRSPAFGSLPPVVKNLLIINVIVFGIDKLLETMGINLSEYLALYYPASQYFMPFQFITYMFMHGNLTHIFFNMFALYMFGRALESVWGSKRFLIYFFVTGIGAAMLHLLIHWINQSSLESALVAYSNTPSPDAFFAFIKENFGQYLNYIKQDPTYNKILNGWYENPGNQHYINASIEYLHSIKNELLNIPTVGASGAVFGVLLAFGMLFPNTQLMLLFPPIPIKAKYLVIGYGAIELYTGILQQPGDNVAHFAHLGGMLFGFILIKYWQKTSSKFY